MKPAQERYRYLLEVSWDALLANRSRSVLTALGIIFGVASVIAMMAIGRGTQKEILEQMNLVGLNNIIILPAPEEGGQERQDSAGNSSTAGTARSGGTSPGLTLDDVAPISMILPNIVAVSPEAGTSMEVMSGGRRMKVRLTGVMPSFFTVFNLAPRHGRLFHPGHLSECSPVCVIGPGVRTGLFPGDDPIGKQVRCRGIWLRVAGVLESPRGNTASLGKLGISDYASAVFVPITTYHRRFGHDAANGTERGADWQSDLYGGMFSGRSAGDPVDKIVVQVSEPRMVEPSAAVLKRALARLHNGATDFEIRIPELVLKQEKRTRNIFNTVLGLIAGISLLVGGIGIMNIMMTSVVERTREIGIRISVGATRRDIIFQFVTESTLISLAGGFIGILLGVVLALAIHYMAGIRTIITPLSVATSFLISASVGILFGYLPARRASRQDPVLSLRHD